MTSDRAELALRPQLRAAGLARSFVTAVLRGWDVLSDRIETAVLLVSELVTNAVRHAGTVMRLIVEHDGDKLRVTVRDDSPAVPQPRSPGVEEPGGRGLLLVDALADTWGVDTTAVGGKCVWFQLTLA